MRIGYMSGNLTITAEDAHDGVQIGIVKEALRHARIKFVNLLAGTTLEIRLNVPQETEMPKVVTRKKNNIKKKGG